MGGRIDKLDEHPGKEGGLPLPCRSVRSIQVAFRVVFCPGRQEVHTALCAGIPGEDGANTGRQAQIPDQLG
jgi:hypothetical protein